MSFNSLQFLVFFPVVAGLFFALPHRARWVLLLAASWLFYGAWSPVYLLLLVFTSALDWYVAIRIEDAPSVQARRWWLGLSLVSNLGILFSFKYYNLVNDTAAALARVVAGVEWPVPRSDLLLPVGISFYTFQSLSYTIDVFRNELKAERRPGIFLLYVAYFPQLVAGPVERASRLLPQLVRPVSFDWDRAASGLRLVAWGMFKKVVVADRLAEVVQVVYSDPTEFGAAVHVLATYFFAYQVYCDFSGYSDIAIGTARVLGVDLMTNFDQPYLSRSYSELWSRWHISMTTWFRDYVYLPLGGSRVSRARWVLNVFVVFGGSGLWHGAAWSYVSWGLVNGAFIVLERFTARPRAALVSLVRLDRAPALLSVVQWSLTFATWLFTLVFFRADSLRDALYIVTHLWRGWFVLLDPFEVGSILIRIKLDLMLLTYCVLLGPFVELVDYGRRTPGWSERFAALPTVPRWALDWALILATLLFGSFGEVPFIYFQF
ncbi:MAG: MBOAT family O-acyltransferase [Myxococcota bacterium]